VACLATRYFYRFAHVRNDLRELVSPYWLVSEPRYSGPIVSKGTKVKEVITRRYGAQVLLEDVDHTVIGIVWVLILTYCLVFHLHVFQTTTVCLASEVSVLHVHSFLFIEEFRELGALQVAVFIKGAESKDFAVIKIIASFECPSRA